MDTEVDLGEYFCLLAEALDADELDSYQQFLLAGGDKRKWKWQSRDKAGTVYIGTGNTTDDVVDKMKSIANTVFKLDLNNLDKGHKKGSGRQFAEITGRPWIMMNPDGVYFDRDATIIQPPFEPGTIIIKIDYDGNDI